MTVMVMASPPTVDPFGIVSTFPVRFNRAAASTVNADLVDKRIQQVLADWEQFNDVPVMSHGVGTNLAPVAPRRAYPVTPLEAVEYVRAVLQVSQDAVLRSAGIAERTYFGWKKRPGSRPRRASMGKLWPLVETLSYLEGAHPNLAAWFHSSLSAQDAFSHGDLNRLLQLELEWIVANASAPAPVAPFFGDLGDRMDVGDVQELEQGVGGPGLSLRPRPRVRTQLPRTSE